MRFDVSSSVQVLPDHLPPIFSLAPGQKYCCWIKPSSRMIKLVAMVWFRALPILAEMGVLDWLDPLAASCPKLPEALVNVLLGAQPAPEPLSFLRIVKGVAARL